MALLTIIKYPDPFLKTKTALVKTVDDSIRELISDMVETMYYAKGIGLAATQVGVDKRIVVLDVPNRRTDDEEDEKPVKGKNLIALINPEIIEAEGTTVYEEGCLSVPGFTADVERAAKVRIKALNKNGEPISFEAGGLFAIALQHEIDHLDGILFIDRLSRLKREMIKRKIKKALESEERAL